MSNWYQEASKRTIDYDYSFLKPHEVELIALAGGICGEAGELFNKLKKGIVHQHGYDTQEVLEEAGDILWYIVSLITRLGGDLDEVMMANVNKLKKRYPKGFDVQKSKERNDEK